MKESKCKRALRSSLEKEKKKKKNWVNSKAESGAGISKRPNNHEQIIKGRGTKKKRKEKERKWKRSQENRWIIEREYGKEKPREIVVVMGEKRIPERLKTRRS